MFSSGFARRAAWALWTIAAGALVLALVCIVVRPVVVDRWSLYASATGGPAASYPLFLEPFPTAFSCEVEARIIVRNGGHAVCRGRRKLEFGTREQDRLLAQFWPSARWLAFCEAQWPRRRGSKLRAASAQ